MNRVGSVLVARERVVRETAEYEIIELPTPIGEATHCAVDFFENPVILLARDAEGVWLVVENRLPNAEIDSFYED